MRIGFMSSAPSLSGTIFTDEDLREARLVWTQLEQRYAPGWFANRRGLISRLFEANTQHAACVLIEIAAALTVVHRNLTSKSVPVFAAKVASLLAVKDEKTLDELLTEILVAATLARSVSERPIDLSKVASSRAGDPARRPRRAAVDPYSARAGAGATRGRGLRASVPALPTCRMRLAESRERAS